MFLSFLEVIHDHGSRLYYLNEFIHNRVELQRLIVFHILAVEGLNGRLHFLILNNELLVVIELSLKTKIKHVQDGSFKDHSAQHIPEPQ